MQNPIVTEGPALSSPSQTTVDHDQSVGTIWLSPRLCSAFAPTFDWLSGNQPRRLPVALIFVTSLMLICGGIAYSDYGAVHLRNYGHDIFVPLDIVWRMANGQRPHLDFYSAWGALAFLFHAFGFRLAGNNVWGLRYGDAMWGLLIGIWSYPLLMRRMQPLAALSAAVALVLMITAPVVLGDSYTHTSHAMGYNREGYAVLGLILLELFQPSYEHWSDRQDLIAGISTGAALAVLLFLKANFFVIGVVLLGLSFVVIRQSTARVYGLLCGFAAVSIGVLAYLRFDALAMWRDYRMAGGAKQDLLLHTTKLSLQGNLPLVPPFLLLFFVAALGLPAASTRWRLQGLMLEGRIFALGVVVILADLALASSNTQKPALPLCGLFAIIVINEAMVRSRSLPNSARPSFLPFGAAIIALAALMAVRLPIRDAASLVYACVEKNQIPTESDVPRVQSLQLSRVYFHDLDQPSPFNGKEYVEYLNDGISLLRKETSDQDSVLSVDLVNPFPYALNRKPAHGGFSVLAYGYVITDRFRPSDASLLGDARVIMVPRQTGFTARLPKLFEPILESSFHLAAESKMWLLYKRVR